MKILHVLDHSIPLHSGYTFRTRAILEQQRCLGWQTYHITSPKHNLVAQPLDDEEEIDGIHFYRSSSISRVMARLPALNQWAVLSALSSRLDAVIQQVKPDIIHAHSPVLNGMAAVKAGKKFNIPVVYEIRAFWEDAAVDHGTTREGSLRFRLTKALETRVIRQASAVTTICEGLRDDIIKRDIPGEKITVIPNAVDIEKFSNNSVPDEALRTQLHLQGKQVLGFLGSFYSYEGLGLLLDALPSILSEAPDVHVLLVGGGPQEDNLKRKAKELDLEDKVIFTGRVSHDEVQRYYSLVDILVYPRLSMRLTELVTPLKPLEAMAQGRLVVASDVGGHRELIEHGVTGVLFKAGDSKALSESILELFNDREQWSLFRQKGRQFVEHERNWAVSVARYKDIYENLISEGQRRTDGE